MVSIKTVCGMEVAGGMGINVKFLLAPNLPSHEVCRGVYSFRLSIRLSVRPSVCASVNILRQSFA